MQETLESQGAGGWPDVDVLIPVYHADALLRKCLTALATQDYPGRYRVIVIDNAETFTLEHFKEEFPSVLFLWESAPGSYNARNTGLKSSAAPCLAFTDGDCSPRTDWLRQGIAALLKNPQAGLAGGKIVIEPVSSGRPTVAEWMEMANGFPQKIYIEKEKFAATANMFTRRAVMDDVGPFNGALKSGGDHDWGSRVAAKGYPLVYAEKAEVGHPARLADEISKKLLRTVGGHRDRKPSWPDCLKFCARYLVPPRKRLIAIARFNHPDFRLTDRIKTMAYALYTNWLAAWFRLKLQVTGGGSSR